MRDDGASGAKRVRFVVLGGFLGAGKTTAVLRLAAHHQRLGRKVGVVTNDQAANLVDTGSARAAGLRVEEVAGACFCCKFDELANLAEKLRVEERPDVLIGEPVGSCTDLAATVVKPLRRLYGDRYSIAPYAVLVDPNRARQIVLERGFGGFSPKVAYVFQKQLEEADLIGLNKVDLLSSAQRDELLAALRREFPRARVLALSGLTGAGFEEFCRELDADRAAGENVADVDYDVYAEGEAELGWLNVALEVSAPRPIDGEPLARAVVEQLRAELSGRGEVAHAKVLFEPRHEESTEELAERTEPRPTGASPAAVANDVGAGSLVRTSGAAVAARRGRLTLNARVHVAPDDLKRAAERALAQVLPRFGADAKLVESAHFRPGRPVPIHRDRATAAERTDRASP
jgi:G3E family GTPase